MAWDEQPVSIDAAGLLAAAGDDQERSALGEAAALAADYLSLGSRPAAEIISEARRADIAEKTLRRAKTRIGARTHREGFGPGSRVLWFLPDRPPYDDPIDDQSPHVSPDDHVCRVCENPHNGAESERPSMDAIDGQIAIDGIDGQETDMGQVWPPMGAGADWNTR